MMNFLKTAAITTCLTSFAHSAQAIELHSIFETTDATPVFTELANISTVRAPEKNKPYKSEVSVGVARLDKGEFIATPFRELRDWNNVSTHASANYRPISVGGYLNNVAEIAQGSTATDNKIDEIRLTARDQGLEHVVIYGYGADANWASIGGKPLRETGLTIPAGAPAWQRGEAKALVVNTYSGEVIGSVVTGFEDVEPGAEILAGRVATLVETLLST